MTGHETIKWLKSQMLRLHIVYTYMKLYMKRICINLYVCNTYPEIVTCQEIELILLAAAGSINSL